MTSEYSEGKSSKKGNVDTRQTHPVLGDVWLVVKGATISLHSRNPRVSNTLSEIIHSWNGSEIIMNYRLLGRFKDHKLTVGGEIFTLDVFLTDCIQNDDEISRMFKHLVEPSSYPQRIIDPFLFVKLYENFGLRAAIKYGLQFLSDDTCMVCRDNFVANAISTPKRFQSHLFTSYEPYKGINVFEQAHPCRTIYYPMIDKTVWFRNHEFNLDAFKEYAQYKFGKKFIFAMHAAQLMHPHIKMYSGEIVTLKDKNKTRLHAALLCVFEDMLKRISRVSYVIGRGFPVLELNHYLFDYPIVYFQSERFSKVEEALLGFFGLTCGYLGFPEALLEASKLGMSVLWENVLEYVGNNIDYFQDVYLRIENTGAIPTYLERAPLLIDQTRWSRAYVASPVPYSIFKRIYHPSKESARFIRLHFELLKDDETVKIIDQHLESLCIDSNPET